MSASLILLNILLAVNTLVLLTSHYLLPKLMPEKASIWKLVNLGTAGFGTILASYLLFTDFGKLFF